MIPHALDAYTKFDLSDVCNTRLGIACTEPLHGGAPGDRITTTRFGACERLDADDTGLVLVMRWDDGSTERVHISRAVYVDGKVVS
jgi:hypothetical protein